MDFKFILFTTFYFFSLYFFFKIFHVKKIIKKNGYGFVWVYSKENKIYTF